MHWRNSEFQIVAFIVGKCHTADEAFRVACEQLEDREVAIASALRFSWGKLWRRFVNFLHRERDALDRQADACYEAALRERDFLKTVIQRLEPHRKYAALTDAAAHQACQRNEWAAELKFRAENFIASQGSVPADHLAAMRQHPDFETAIAPHVQSLLEQAQAGKLTLSAKPVALLLENKP